MQSQQQPSQQIRGLRAFWIAERYFDVALTNAKTAQETAHYYRAMLHCARILKEGL